MKAEEKRGLGLFLTLVLAIVGCGLVHAMLPPPRPRSQRISAVNNLVKVSSIAVPVAASPR